MYSLTLRPATVLDLKVLKEIHQEHYSKQFECPRFDFLVENNNIIISGGCIRPIPELILVTDLNQSPRTRVDSLLHVLEYFKDKQFHVFVQDEKWERQLKSFGFRDTKGKALIYG